MTRLVEMFKSNGIDMIEDVLCPPFMADIASYFISDPKEMIQEHNEQAIRKLFKINRCPDELVDAIVAGEWSEHKAGAIISSLIFLGTLRESDGIALLAAYMSYKNFKGKEYIPKPKSELIRLISLAVTIGHSAERTVTVGRYTLHTKDGWFKIDESTADLHTG